MPFSFYFDEGTQVFHIRAAGAVNDLELMDLNDRIHREPAFTACYPIVCDCTAVTEVSVSASLIELLAKAARLRTNVVAVIAPCAVAFGLARMYQIFSDPENTRISVFAEAKEALMWVRTKSAARGPTVGAYPREPEGASKAIRKRSWARPSHANTAT
jgi:hypothetical protein